MTEALRSIDGIDEVINQVRAIDAWRIRFRRSGLPTAGAHPLNGENRTRPSMTRRARRPPPVCRLCENVKRVHQRNGLVGVHGDTSGTAFANTQRNRPKEDRLWHARIEWKPTGTRPITESPYEHRPPPGYSVVSSSHR